MIRKIILFLLLPNLMLAQNIEKLATFGFENLQERYECACQILANMIEDMEYDSYSNAEMVDMTICKMFIDGFIKGEKKPRIYH